MPDVLVGVGSNVDPARALRMAVVALGERFGAVRCSSVYSSPAVGGAGADYLNMVVALTTVEPVAALRAALRAIEERAGRRRGDPRSCALDLDLLCYGVCVDATGGLPRPGMFTLPFVLGPLAELEPGLVHPLTGQRCREAWQAAPRGGIRNVGALRSLG